MTRTDKQAAIANAATTLSDNIKSGTATAEAGEATSSIAKNGEPKRILGAVFQMAGLLGKNQSLPSSNQAALAQILDVQSSILPAPIKSALDKLTVTEKHGRYPSERRNRSRTALLGLAEALRTSTVRKPYTRSGRYTAAAKAAGTFGTSPAPTAPAPAPVI